MTRLLTFPALGILFGWASKDASPLGVMAVAGGIVLAGLFGASLTGPGFHPADRTPSGFGAPRFNPSRDGDSA